MLINKILENCLLSVVTLHLQAAFHLQHIALILMSENNIVGVDLKPHPQIQISTITRKNSEQIIRFSWPHFLIEILMKNPIKTKEEKTHKLLGETTNFLVKQTNFHQKAELSDTTICHNPNQGNPNAYIHNPKIPLA